MFFICHGLIRIEIDHPCDFNKQSNLHIAYTHSLIRNLSNHVFDQKVSYFSGYNKFDAKMGQIFIE